MDSLEGMKEVYGELPATGIEEVFQPEEMALSREQAEMVRGQLSALPEKYKMALYLYFSAELSIKEMAVCLKIPEGTVKSRLYKAKQLMKERLEDLL